MEQKDLLATARERFLNSFNAAVQKTIPNCVESMFIRASESFSSLEQNKLLDARLVLVERESLILDLMLKHLNKLLNRSLQTAYSTFRPSFEADLTQLSLIDPFAYEGDLKLEEITSRFRGESAEQLRDLNIRIALIFEQDTTNERENPFRPYLLSKCVSMTFEELEVSQDITSLLLIQFSEKFIAHTSTIYKELNSYLAGQGIAAQLQLKVKKSPVKPVQQHDSQEEAVDIESDDVSNGAEVANGIAQIHTSTSKQESHQVNRQSTFEQIFSGALKRAANLIGMSGNTSTVSSAGGQQTSTKGAQASYGVNHGESVSSERASKSRDGDESSNVKSGFAWVKDGESIGHVLRDFFGESSESLGNTDSVASINEIDHNSTVSPSAGVLKRSIQYIQKTQTPSGTEIVNAQGEVRNLILEQRATLNEVASNEQEQMTIDVVAMLFEYILRDNQVPAEVRAQLGRLQFLLLKIALKDVKLLSQKSHPARLLVNRIGSVSLTIKDGEQSGVLITGEICRIVELLLNDEAEDSSIFIKLLDEFDDFIAKELRAENKKTESAIEGAEKARNRIIRFTHTTEKLREALNTLTIDPVLREFFESAWVYVVDLADGQDHNRAYRYRLVVPDLLWSIVPKTREEDRLQLLALLPIMLSTLKEGLESIQWEDERNEKLMNWLVMAHTKSIRLSTSATLEQYPSLSAIHNHFNQFFKDADTNDYAIIRNQSSSEIKNFLNEAIKDLDVKVQLLDHLYEDELPSNDTKLMEEKSGDADFVMEKLRTGIAIELRLGGEPSEGRLSWIDPALTSLILNIDGQEEPSIVSIRMFRRMIAHGRVRFMEAEPLFERAVQSLLKSADAPNKEESVLH